MAEIIAISAGRKNKVTESLIRAILQATGKSYELISLSGLIIRPCEACKGCVKTNKCVLEDDLQPIIDKMHQAKAIVFGAPTYWDHMNAKGQAFWERVCFSSRHNALFPLAGKPGVIVAVDGIGDGRYVIRDAGLFFEDARINLVDTIVAQGEYACFSCGYGNRCSVGGFVELFPLGTPITKEIIPTITNQHPEICNLEPSNRTLIPQAKKIAEALCRVMEF